MLVSFCSPLYRGQHCTRSSAPCSSKPKVHPGNLPSVYGHHLILSYSFAGPRGRTYRGSSNQYPYTGIQSPALPVVNCAAMNNRAHVYFTIVGGIPSGQMPRGGFAKYSFAGCSQIFLHNGGHLASPPAMCGHISCLQPCQWNMPLKFGFLLI